MLFPFHIKVTLKFCKRVLITLMTGKLQLQQQHHHHLHHQHKINNYKSNIIFSNIHLCTYLFVYLFHIVQCNNILSTSSSCSTFQPIVVYVYNGNALD